MQCIFDVTLAKTPRALHSNGTLGTIDVCSSSAQQLGMPIAPPLSSRVLWESSPPVNRVHMVWGGGVRYIHFMCDPVRNKNKKCMWFTWSYRKCSIYAIILYTRVRYIKVWLSYSYMHLLQETEFSCSTKTSLVAQRYKDAKALGNSTIFQMPLRQMFIELHFCFFIFFWQDAVCHVCVPKICARFSSYPVLTCLARLINFLSFGRPLMPCWSIDSDICRQLAAWALKSYIYFERPSFPLVNNNKTLQRSGTMTHNTSCPSIVFDCLECFLSVLENCLVARQCYDIRYVCYGAAILYSTICIC